MEKAALKFIEKLNSKKICKYCGVETISNEEDNCYKNPNKLKFDNEAWAKEYSDLFDRLKVLRMQNDELKELLRMSKNYLSNTNCIEAINKCLSKTDLPLDLLPSDWETNNSNN